MKLTLHVALGLLLIGALALIPVSFDTVPPTDDISAYAQLNQDPGTGDGDGGCTYCDEPACGCPSPPLGCTLTFSCACSSISCTRTCDVSC